MVALRNLQGPWVPDREARALRRWLNRIGAAALVGLCGAGLGLLLSEILGVRFP